MTETIYKEEYTGFVQTPITPVEESFWSRNMELILIVGGIFVILYIVGAWFSREEEKPVKKTQIQILTEANVSFTQQIGILSEKKQDLVMKRNALDVQISNADSSLATYYGKIDENTQKLKDLRNPSVGGVKAPQ